VATVLELSAPYENHLLPVLPSSAGVCAVCHSFVAGDWPLCYQCNQAVRLLPKTADALGFVALAVKGEQLARDLSVYKNSQSLQARTRPRLGLAAVLWRWMESHERCLATEAGTDGFQVVTTVPSTSGREQHPLDHVVGTMVQPTADRFRSLLRRRPNDTGGREFGVDRFEVINGGGAGNSVLIIDDTFTSGSHAQSAAAALKDSGAESVAVLCIGRHFNRQQDGEEYRQAADAYYRRSRVLGWNWDRCCLNHE
jgi:predicted amidophosphoribosyltransferase